MTMTAAPSPPGLEHSLLLSLADAVDPDVRPGAQAAAPLPGAELSWRQWRDKYGGGVVDQPLGPHHTRVWEWFAALEPGVKPAALIECWSRGHGKSTTIETNVARLCVTAKRRFVVYVSGTQEAADRHVQSIAELLERLGVGRAVNRYGFSRGWRGNLLRTANGFNVLAFGLDAGARGVKLGELRPDLLVFDDVDSRHDSVPVAEKKGEVIAETVLPAGSADSAAVFVQNAIHAHSVMVRTLSGENGILRRRVPTEAVPAVVGLQYAEVTDTATGRSVWKITGGAPSWAGKPLPVCENEINEFGLLSFLRECQHDTGVGGRFFEEWQSALPGRESVHEVYSFPLPRHYTFWGGMDWGKRAPFAFYLIAADTRGNLLVVDECYEAGLTNEQQAAAILASLAKTGREAKTITVYADPAIFPPRDPAKRVGKYIAEDFWKAGVRLVPANNDRVNGWSRVKEYMNRRDSFEVPAKGRTVTVAGLRVFLDRCPHLCRTLPKMVPNPHNPEDLDTTLEDHSVDGLRYAVERPGMAQKPKRRDDRSLPDPHSLPFALRSADEGSSGEWE